MASVVSRRNFLKYGSVAAVAGATLRPVGAAEKTSVPPARGTEKLFRELAVATICTDGFGNRKHEPAFRLIPQLGVKNVEFNVWFPDTITPNCFRGLKECSMPA